SSLLSGHIYIEWGFYLYNGHKLRLKNRLNTLNFFYIYLTINKRKINEVVREVAFIKQNKEKWLEFEKALYKSSENKPERLAELFIQINNDLAYAQTYYPKSNVIKYLNAITVTAY